jgi:SAM-dependent methyltransferase
MIELICPLDGGKIIDTKGNLSCKQCNTSFPMVEISNQRIPDFRCLNKSTDVTLTFTIPQNPLQTGKVDQFGIATEVDFQCLSREEIRKLYRTHLEKESLYYIDVLLNQVGTNAVILDLGCGKGGNKKYLESVGFHNVISVDYSGTEYMVDVQYLVDVHRMPFDSESFDMIISTATLELFYNPYIAFKEMNRVLKSKGMLIASGGFWENWQDNSCFHFTPGGLDLLCQFAGLELSDMWSGWGFIPSVSSHALGLGKYKKVTYQFQIFFDFIVSLFAGYDALKRHRFRTSGSFGLFAQKMKDS